MKKNGFTLAEMVISITVVGVIAALSVPLVSSIIPDRKKIQVLKVHKLLTHINQEILADKGLYLPDGDCSGLNCTEPPSNPDWDWTDKNEIRLLAGGGSKYIAILADRLKVTNFDGISSGSATGSFTTSDGNEWRFSKENDLIQIEVDIDPNGNNCIHSTDCANPDTFRFSVVPETGRVLGADSLTITYLANPHNLSDRKNDFNNSLNMQGKSQSEN